MRYFVVWLDKNTVGCEPVRELIEFPDDATDEECNEACADCLDTLIANELDTGWDELTQEEVGKLENL